MAVVQSRPVPRFSLAASAATLAVLLHATAAAAGAGSPHADAEQLAGLPSDLTKLSLDQLLDIEVTSVSKRPERALTAAAAIFVLSGDDIRRAGARSIAGALRLVPGLDVAQIDSRSYAIAARGFNGSTSDKLQVLLDGRTVYTPLTSAVFWDVLDTYLDDIERIEVIRGPGATLWGANAVNGVINIVTRHAQDTVGTAISGGTGSVDRSFAALRSGTQLGRAGAARIYAKAQERAASALADGSDAQDSTRVERAGFRADGGSADAWTLSGDFYSARFHTAPSPQIAADAPTKASGGNLLGRWTRGENAASGWTLQAYYDHYRREIPGTYEETRDTADLDFQRHQQLGTRNTLTYGLGYRSSHDDTAAPPDVAIVFTPPSRTLETQTGFVQDQLHFDDDRVVVTLGSKFEHNDFTGFEMQPGLRVGWTLAEHAFTWAAVSRAVRTPNRLDTDVAIYCPPPDGYPGVCGPGLLRVGNPDFHAEKVVSYEWGLRLWGVPQLSIDLASFFSDYRDLRSQEAATAEHPFIRFDNRNRAQAYGGELTLNWTPSRSVSVQSFYSLLRLDARHESGSSDLGTADVLEGASPRHQAGLRVLTQPAERWQLDGFLRYVDKLPAYAIDAYTELDLRAAYRPLPQLEVALAGRNLLDKRHIEFGSASRQIAVERAAFIEVRWFWE